MTNPPLAERMRPQLLEEYIGQQHLIGPKGVLLKHCKTNSSLLLFFGTRVWVKQP